MREIAVFFEKKKQKAFVCAVADLAGKVRVSTNKSFLALFLEKGLLACYESWSRPAGISQDTSSLFESVIHAAGYATSSDHALAGC